jgi:hypothetical protein
MPEVLNHPKILLCALATLGFCVKTYVHSIIRKICEIRGEKN